MDQQKVKELVRRRMKRDDLRDGLRADFDSTVEQRIDRYLEINHHWITGNHHFTEASSECIYLYRDGHFIAAVMMSHAINDGIVRFVADRNGVLLQDEKGDGKSIPSIIDEFITKKLLSAETATLSKAISGSYRNDVHHMNPNVLEIDFFQLAKQNLSRLSAIEKEIFGVDVTDGKLRPHNPIYWDVNSDGTVNAFLRLE